MGLSSVALLARRNSMGLVMDRQTIDELSRQVPMRTLEAVDPARTTIQIEDENLGGVWFRRIRFPYGVIFRDAELAGIHSFADLDTHSWCWSRELIDAAKDGGFKDCERVHRGCWAETMLIGFRART